MSINHEIIEKPKLAREEADRLYRTTQTIADPAAMLQRLIDKSTAYRKEHPGILDLAYGPGPDERVDIFLPDKGVAGAPVHIFIHGGYWYQCGKHEWSFLAEALTEAGAIVLVPRYSLCPTVAIGEIVAQMRTLVAWVAGKISNYGGDSTQLYLSGHSAGGHLVTEMALTDWTSYGLPEDILKGVTSISGLYDLRPLLSTYVQEHIRLSYSDAVRLSPLLHARSISTALTVAVGGNEAKGFLRQMDEFTDVWQESGNTIRGITLTGHDHFSLLHEFSDRDGILAIAVKEQMNL